MNQKRDPEKKNGLFIPTRQATAYTSFALSLLGAVFMAGYFFGKQHMIDQCVTKIEHDSFADQISASLCSLYDQELESLFVQKEAELLDDSIELDSLPVISENAQFDAPEMVVADCSQVIEEPALPEAPISSPEHYAQLIGYGTQKAADQFAQRLQKKGIPAVVKIRKSQTAQGKKSTWYQVVTEPFSDKHALEQLVQRIAKDEKIQGIQLVSC
ncbi:MAG: hypothetical protein ACD_64C00332G0002 [uncultured bacterium]|nr:MAG: hypothetical protein ACD_64C00332G0002 [uncultured bacterium]